MSTIKNKVVTSKKPVEVKVAKANQTTKGKLTKKTGDSKDRSKLIFNGKKYGKGRVVQAVIEKYVETHPNITSKQLEEAFPSTLHSLGLIQPLVVAKRKSKDHRRYFFKEPLALKDKKVAICSEFGTGNIFPFLEQAKKLGFDIKSKISKVA